MNFRDELQEILARKRAEQVAELNVSDEVIKNAKIVVDVAQTVSAYNGMDVCDVIDCISAAAHDVSRIIKDKNCLPMDVQSMIAAAIVVSTHSMQEMRKLNPQRYGGK